MPYRITVDTGGTFSDVVIADSSGILAVEKALTTPENIFGGIRTALEIAAHRLGKALTELFNNTEILIYATTHATNATVQNKVAKTAFLTTEGFPDVLVLREGGRPNAHQFDLDYPEPYVPRRRTFEIRERVSSEGERTTPLDVVQACEVAEALAKQDIEAVAVCFLWSIVNPVNEVAMATILDTNLPGVPYTLSHLLLPTVREYRRASATAIDASLKPLMQTHLREMEEHLREAGYRGEILVSTSMGGCMHVEELAAKPIHSIKSGPAMAPVAGRDYAKLESLGDDVIVCDAGGTTFDVGLVRNGSLMFTRETWIGEPRIGHIIGMSSVDVRSIGAGGGSIAWIDSGGLLRVGPHSAGARPGPACYGLGGTGPTVTDAALVLGYLNAEYFLGGRMQLDIHAAHGALGPIAEQLGYSLEHTAFAILTVANEHMIGAIREITINEGLDPRDSVLLAGGGAAGMNILPIARELECRCIMLPKSAGALTACGMQSADIVYEYSASGIVHCDNFDLEKANVALQNIDAELNRFKASIQERGLDQFEVDYFVEARYLGQVWELDVPLAGNRFRTSSDVDALAEAFHQVHERVHAVRDEASPIECVNWKARLTAQFARPIQHERVEPAMAYQPEHQGSRRAFFGQVAGIDNGTAESTRQSEHLDAKVFLGWSLMCGATLEGPAIIEEPTTTIVIYPGMSARVSDAGNYLLRWD